MASDSLPWRSLHPGSVAVNLLPRTVRLLRAGWPFLLYLVMRGGSPTRSNLSDAAVVAALFALTLGRTLVHFLTLRYRVHHGRLEIRSGLLYRQVRAIDPERIQNVELARNVAHRLTGLVEVRVETASGTEVEGLLSALSVEDAEELVAVLEHARRGAVDRSAEAPEPEIVVATSFSDLVRYGATAARVGALALVAVGVTSDATRWLPPEQAAALQTRFTWVLGVVIGVGTLSGAWLVGIALAIVRHWGFSLALAKERLIATEGLLSTRRVELRLSKVQLVLVNQTLPRRVAGFASVQIETAATRDAGGAEGGAQAFVPVVDTDDLDRVVAIALPHADVKVHDSRTRRPHPRSLWRMLTASAISTGALVGLALGFFGYEGLWALLLFPVNIATTALDFRMQGWLVSPRMVYTRGGYWNLRTLLIDRSRVQSLLVEEGPLQRLFGLASLRVRVAGSSVRLPEVDTEQAYALLDTLRGRSVEAADGVARGG